MASVDRFPTRDKCGFWFRGMTMAIARCAFSIGLVWALLPGLAPIVLGADAQKNAPPVASPYAPAENPAIDRSPSRSNSDANPDGPDNRRPGEAANEADGPDQSGKSERQDSPSKPDDGKKEPIQPIHRPPAPAASPNPEEFKVQPDKTGKIRLRFNGQPWQPVLEWLAKISGMSLDWQELPGDCINLSTQRSYTVAEARDLINRLLLARGYTLLCHGEVMTVAEVKKLDPSLVPRIEPGELSRRDPHEFVKVSFPLATLLAETAAEELKPMLSPNGHMTALSETNRLEAMDAVQNLREIEAVLKQEAEDDQPRSFREFKLKYARADEVNQLLSTLLGIEPSKSSPPMEQQGGMNPEQQQAMMMARMQAHNMEQQQGGPQVAPKPKSPPVSIAVNQRRNSILVRARPDKMVVIAQVVDAVDIPVSHDDTLLVNLNRMQVYRLSGIDPEPVVKTLSEIGNLAPTTRLEIDRKNNALIAYASLPDHVTIRAVVDKLSGSERKFEVIHLRRLEADYVAGTIDFMMGSGGKKNDNSRSSRFFGYVDSSRREGDTPKEFHVDADVEHNRLLLWANPVELASVEALLVKLGEIPAGGGAGGVRVIDSGDPQETQELIEKIRRAWPAVAPNTLLAPVTPPPDESKGTNRPQSLPPKDSSVMPPLPEQPPRRADAAAKTALFHLADIQFPPPGNAATEREPDQASASGRVAGAARPAPPVKLAVGPDGKMIISSEDGSALDRMEELAAQLATPRKDYHVFHLKYVAAVGVVLNLRDFFQEEKKERPRSVPWWYDDTPQNNAQDDRRLSKRRKLTFISDTDSNTILVEGASAEQLKTIEDLIQIYDQPPPTDSQSVRKTEIIRLKYSKAKAVADTVKDVYRDLLSANDKALSNDNQGRGGRNNYIFNLGDSDGDPKTPKFKGLLSMGVDEVSNSVMVSAPAYLFEHVTRMIKQLDEAAAPDYTVRIVRVHDMSPVRLKALIDSVYMQKASAEEPATGAPSNGYSKRPAGKSSKPASRGQNGQNGHNGDKGENRGGADNG
jgi:type II secretory pathway component GspD/PulD (secretin)